MITVRRKRAIQTCSLALGVVSALLLAGCAENGTSSAAGGTGQGVNNGATMEEYKAAFADVDPITLNTQSPAPKGSATGKNVEKYLDAVTKWSDGKITFKVAYANAVAPPTESDNALLDGRLDLAQVLPLYEPAEFPANAALIEAGFISDQSAVVGNLQSNAWPNQVAFGTAEIEKEFEDHGMKVLLPVYNSGANVLFCANSRLDLASLKGVEVASGGQAQSNQVKALGGSPSSVAYPEIFESLQRGVVDCTVSSMTVGVLGGFVSVAPHLVVDTNAGFALAPGAMAMSKDKWDTLPLVAQQLLWDRLDVFLRSNIEDKIWPNIVDAAKQAKAAGGGIEGFAPDAAKAINDANDKMLADLRGTKAVADGNKLVDDAKAASDAWLKTVRSLGFEDAGDYNGFAASYRPGQIDLDPYVKKVYDEIFLPHRPS
jgi:TRAP-type C4-dicarboxylate transport system substrate-binding protein